MYQTDGSTVTLRIFDGTFDRRMAALVAKWNREGYEIELNGLLALSYLREKPHLNAERAADLFQITRDAALDVLHDLSLQSHPFVERRGRGNSVTYHLTRPVASELLGKGVYTETRGILAIRYAEMVKEFLADHGEITPKACRELFHLGESQTVRVEISRLLRKWSGSEGFLVRTGKPPKVIYRLRETEC